MYAEPCKEVRPRERAGRPEEVGRNGFLRAQRNKPKNNDQEKDQISKKDLFCIEDDTKQINKPVEKFADRNTSVE